MALRLSLVVTTYERPDALERVLAAVAAQARLPDEVVIADDGSGPATAVVVQQAAAHLPCRVVHAWQPDEGFRVARARNLAVSRATGDYLVFIDGDMVMHRQCLADHASLARPGHWLQGPRLLLDAAATAATLAGAVPVARPWQAGLRRRHRLQALRLPRAAAALATLAGGVVPNALLAVKGANFSCWRADFARVNGFDEAYVGWGAEDKDLAARLHNAGVARQSALWAALAFHLDHPPAARTAAAGHRARWLATRRSGATRCAAGLDGHVV